MSKRGIIVAVSEDGVIGINGQMPWHYPADLKRFRQVTTDTAVIMGRNTWNSLYIQPLPNRRNIVITSRPIEGVECYTSIQEALKHCKNTDVWFIGGAQIYKEALQYADTVDLTVIPEKHDQVGAVKFPELDKATWHLQDERPLEADPKLTHRVFTRVGADEELDDEDCEQRSTYGRKSGESEFRIAAKGHN